MSTRNNRLRRYAIRYKMFAGTPKQRAAVRSDRRLLAKRRWKKQRLARKWSCRIMQEFLEMKTMT